MLDDIKLLLGLLNDDKDELLELLIKQATLEAQLKTGLTTVTAQLKVAIIKMVIFNYNRLGTEGLESESYSGVSYNYSSNYPDEITALLDSCKALNNGLRILW